ncbi:MAG: YifB family Mg chelatase-like AAA ATPase [Deferribacteraceae bacterium]|jgi:magnesium chelatase family protein|nr:YifB family Mg chelatase-like AAA ATPase [Deferribacteraceae bacterium]
MFIKIMSAHLAGINATDVAVEVDIATFGMPSFSVVGLAEGALRESKERVRSALRNLDYNIFARPITVNLAPADIKKEGSHFDLPMAVGLLAAMQPKDFDVADTLFLGELSLDGALRGVSGVLCICSWAAELGIKRIVLPMENADEAALVPNIEIYPFDHLSAVIGFLKGELPATPYKAEQDYFERSFADYDMDFAEVKGQHTARRAAEIAAAGLHNILMMGSPGSGKTMIARRIPSILPPMSLNEALLTTKIHSIAGLLRNKGNLIKERPYISPHHTASDVAIIGGGAKAMPGHVSIATNGVLFLDEMLEFNRSVLEVLRQPMEDGVVTIARAGRTVTYPANFMLVAASNPCPCGYYGDARKRCTCAPHAVERYRARLSGPLLDRIDLQVVMTSVDVTDLENQQAGESSATIRARVMLAHAVQAERFKDLPIAFNSQMNERMLAELVLLEDAARKLAGASVAKFALSARAYNKILKLSRTIADLAGSKTVTAAHVAEALQYRMLSGG